jgi:polyphosphate kinase 2 (PPK2 family)
MLEKVDLKLKISKEEYKQQLPQIGGRFTLLQRACHDAGIPVIVLFEGWDASGKGTTINLLTQYMDPRGFNIIATKGSTEQEQQMPWLWRFWTHIPPHGEVAVFDRSWYGWVGVERVEKLVDVTTWQQAYQNILDFERTLADDGYLLIKFFLHISRKEQKHRFNRLEADPLEKWRVQKEDWKHHKKYDVYLEAYEEMLARTETEWGSWTIVEATDKHWSRLKVFNTLNTHLEEALKQRGKPLPAGLDDVAQQVAAGEAED